MANDILSALKAPFPASDIEWRVQRAMKTKHGDRAMVLAYITARAVMERLDEVFGLDGWTDEYQRWGTNGVLCTIKCKIGDQWISKTDGADDTNIEPTKGGISDAFKRAAVKWGIGRYLYNLDSNWVEIGERGDYYINDRKAGVQGRWSAPQLPAWALPEGQEKTQTTQTPKQAKRQPTQRPRQVPSNNGQSNRDAVTAALRRYHAVATPLIADEDQRKDFLRYSSWKMDSRNGHATLAQSTRDIAPERINTITNNLDGQDSEHLMDMLDGWREEHATVEDAIPA